MRAVVEPLAHPAHSRPLSEVARRAIPALIERESLDFVIANVENSAAGFGVTGDIAETILSYGVDAMTSGNHVWDKKDVLDYIPQQPKLLRPANFPAGAPGRGSYLGRTRTGEPIGVITLGRQRIEPFSERRVAIFSCIGVRSWTSSTTM